MVLAVEYTRVAGVTDKVHIQRHVTTVVQSDRRTTGATAVRQVETGEPTACVNRGSGVVGGRYRRMNKQRTVQ